MNQKVILITGSAKRIGAEIATYFHSQHYRVIVHYRESQAAANTLVANFNKAQKDSAVSLQADLDQFSHYDTLIQKSIAKFGRLDVLVNNASTFFKTPIDKASEATWDLLFNSNLKAPFFLSKAAAPVLKQHGGSIINIIDIYAQRPMKNYPIYSCAKAGLAMLTRALALELAPDIRVNGIAPGHVLWPSDTAAFSEIEKNKIMQNTPLGRAVAPTDIAKTALFLAENDSITGEIVSVDAGRNVVI